MQNKPLSGIRVLEFGGYISVPYGSSMLSALGADVVKVEKPGSGDDFRRHQNEVSPYFIQYNAGKRSLAVDLKHRTGVEVVKDLIPRFDVIIENMRPGKMDALGLGPEACRAIRQDLVYVSVTGFGGGGPLEQRPAYDTIGQSFSGMYSILSEAGSAQLSGTIFADLVTGFSAATGVLAALVSRGHSGVGQHVETSIMESMSALTADALSQYYDTRTEPSRTSRHPQAQNFCLETGSGEFMAIHLSSSQKFWRYFVDSLHRGELFEDPRFLTYPDRCANYFALDKIFQSEFVTRSFDEWTKVLTAADVPFAPVLTMSGYAEHPQTEWLEVLEPERHGIRLVRPPFRFDGVRPDRPGVAPRVGQHTEQIASEVYDGDRIGKLLAAGVLFADPSPITTE